MGRVVQQSAADQVLSRSALGWLAAGEAPRLSWVKLRSVQQLAVFAQRYGGLINDSAVVDRATSDLLFNKFDGDGDGLLGSRDLLVRWGWLGRKGVCCR